MLRKKLFKLIKIFLVSILTICIFLIAIIYFSFHKKIPDGITGIEADQFALKIQEAIQHDKFNNTHYIQWTFRNKHNYFWNKKEGTVKVAIGEYIYKLYLTTPQKNTIISDHNFSEKEETKRIQKAVDNFNNDSFWVVAPHKLFDNGVTRKLVLQEDGTKSLLITYTNGGSTPGDSYLWKVDQNYLPTSYQMWVSILPIGGLEATWDNWITTESGAYLSQQHQLLGFGIPITNLKAWND